MKFLTTIETVPLSSMRYPTCGDWLVRPSGYEILVAEMKDRDSEFLVALHELVEAYLCEKAEITDEVVTAFDKLFEKNRAEGDDSEPGDAPDAPYRQQHRTATLVEMIVADAAGIVWKDHEANVNALF